YRVETGLRADRAEFTEPVPAPQPWDPQTVIYTSGTTGPSKGGVSSYAHLYSSCTAAFHGMAGPQDRYLLLLPLSLRGRTSGADGATLTAPATTPRPRASQTVIYTSGTTGPSKGVVSSYAHLYSSCTAAFHGMAGPQDRYLLQLPLFHAGGTIGAYGMLVHGGSVTVVPAFSTGEFWPLIRRTGTTLCTLLGVMATYLLKQPP